MSVGASLLNSMSVNPESHGKALVIGGGFGAYASIEALLETGFEVTYMNCPTDGAFVRETGESSNLPNSFDEDKIRVLEDLGEPILSKTPDGFKLVSKQSKDELFTCVVVAPDVPLVAVPPKMSPYAKQLTVSDRMDKPGNYVFLCDFEQPSDPALVLAAARMALENQLSEGSSVLLLKNIPLPKLETETFFDELRRSGVLIIKYYDDDITLAESATETGSTLSIRHVVGNDDRLELDFDELFYVGGPDPAGIPKWARDYFEKERNNNSFLRHAGIHQNSYRSWNSGIFVVGPAAGTYDSTMIVHQARLAAAHAKQLFRDSDGVDIKINSSCARCLNCYRICPHGAISLSSDGSQPLIAPISSLCRSCGICVSTCPNSAIELTIPQKSGQSDTLQLQSIGDHEQAIIFVCRESAGILASNLNVPDNIKFIEVLCAGSVSENMIWEALTTGARGVIVAGCHSGACASKNGTDLASARIKAAVQTGIFENKSIFVKHIAVSANEPARFQKLLDELIDN